MYPSIRGPLFHQLFLLQLMITLPLRAPRLTVLRCLQSFRPVGAVEEGGHLNVTDAMTVSMRVQPKAAVEVS